MGQILAFAGVVLSLVGVASGREAAFFNDVRIPMRDGVSLAGDLYLPTNRAEKVGCLMLFSPYGATAADRPYNSTRAEEWGVATLAVDCRGLCHSKGVFEPWEGRLVDDADDLLKWIAAQPWSNGRVVTVGGSYPGWTQLACLKSANPALVACAPSVITFFPYSINYQNGVLIPEFFRKWHTGLAGEESWRELARHPDREDAFWRRREGLGDLGKSKARVLYQAGWFDMLGVETFRSFALMPKGSVLRVGPWSHGVNTFDKPDFTYADKPGAVVSEDLELEFLRSALEGRASETVAAQPRIRVYTMGRNAWQTLDAWPPGAAVDSRYHFTARANGVRSLARDFWEGSGFLERDSLDYYPDDPTPSKGCRIIGAGGQYDQREIESRADVLSYTSDALEEEVEVTGEVRATLCVSSTAPQSDVVVRLVDVCPDGRALGVLEGVRRADFIVGVERRLDWTLDATSYAFLPGHRIRIDIAGAAHPHFAKSPNAARIGIRLGNASCITLPTMPSATKETKR